MPLFLVATYLFTQSFIVGTSNVVTAAEGYLKKGVVREESYLDINDHVTGAKKYPVFPAKFTPRENATDWLYETSIIS